MGTVNSLADQVGETGKTVVPVVTVDQNGNYVAGGGGGGGGAVTVSDGADTAQGTTTDAANANTVIGQLKQINVNLADTLTDGDFLTTIATNTSNTNTQATSLNTAIGGTTDAAVVGDASGSVNAHARGLTKILNDIWDSTNHLLHHNTKQIGGTAVDTNSGTKSGGTQRIVIATDQPALTNAQPANISQLLGSAYSNTNPFVTETNIQNWIRSSKGYVASLSFSASVTTAIQGLSVFNASGNNKTVIIYRIMNLLTVGRGTAPTYTLTYQTSDPGPGWTSGVVLTPQNMVLGGAASAMSAYRSAATSGVSIAGTTLWTGDSSTDIQIEMLQQGQVIVLPSGSSSGVTSYVDTSTGSGGCAIAVFYVEF